MVSFTAGWERRRMVPILEVKVLRITMDICKMPTKMPSLTKNLAVLDDFHA